VFHLGRVTQVDELIQCNQIKLEFNLSFLSLSAKDNKGVGAEE
jgi:hypothetical protein